MNLEVVLLTDRVCELVVDEFVLLYESDVDDEFDSL